MKNLLLFTVIFFISMTVSFSQTEKTKEVKSVNKKAPIITFIKNLHDFGEIPNRGDGTYEFEFKNTGKEPLIITNVRSSCGCTIPLWPKEPIKKGGKNVIKVKYDTKRVGNFTKTITVRTNAKNPTEVLTIKGKVLPKTNNSQVKKEVVKPKAQPIKTNKMEKAEKLEEKPTNKAKL